MWNMIWPLLLIVFSNCFYNIGLEAGYVFLYRAGWKVMNAIIESSIEIISICGKDNRKHEVLQSSHERLRLHHEAAQRHLYGCR